MARKRRTTTSGDASFDAGASARQIGLFESANGVPHGIVAIVAAFLIAAITYPLYRLRGRR
jgi:hypothetical protein